ncbi:MAG: DNA mismatch repair endonuclease MutL [Holosporaceae bacterium]|nr:DNA mismatch repair endonuclease MutL [Holosporaceae bacterium]
MKIKLLSQNLVNQIAAGEVIERPSSVVKELMENAIDAGAAEIEVKIIDAGKSFVSVADDGCGLDRESLSLCLLNHATSKLSSENLFDIHTFGFRGEALPSIASISRLTITSAMDVSTEAWAVRAEGAQISDPFPDRRRRGTTVEVRDLFFATPARLKFLKSDAAEADGCYGVFQRIALAFNEISFSFVDSGKQKFLYPRTTDPEKRVLDVLGDAFTENAFTIDARKDGLRLHGFIGVPTFNKASAGHQYFFVNRRFVKDKIFAYALKSAYAGLTPPGRHAVAILHLEISFDEVDVNAHPSKIEVRFREAERVRGFITAKLKENLLAFGANWSSSERIIHLSREKSFVPSFHAPRPGGKIHQAAPDARPYVSVGSNALESTASEDNIVARSHHSAPAEEQEAVLIRRDESEFFLGRALCQIDNTYVVAVCDHELVIVDQHAAAERITLEKLKNNVSLDAQTLLLPDVCPLGAQQVELLENNRELLLRFGFHHEKLADDLVIITALPAILETCDAKSLLADVVEELAAFGSAYTLEEKIIGILSTISCHGSLRAGKPLTIAEMDTLLRQMENSPNIAQCCHGRPSYVRLSNKNLNNFFERS